MSICGLQGRLLAAITALFWGSSLRLWWSLGGLARVLQMDQNRADSIRTGYGFRAYDDG